MTETEQAIEHFEYGISHDIFSEPVTTYARLAVAALRAQLARENPQPLTLEQLRERDGKSAYFQFGDGADGNAVIEWQSESGFVLYGPVADDHDEPDVVFINMEYNDPDGHFGLHLLGWRAYDYPPKENAL